MPRRWIMLLLIAWGTAACTPAMPRQRGDISQSLKERVGYGVGTFRYESVLPEGVNLKDGLTEEEAVAVALSNNATLQATLSRLGFSEADLYRAGALANPVFSLFFPLGPKQLEMAINWGIDWIWKRPLRVHIASLNVEQTAESLVASGLDTVRDTKVVMTDVLLARRRAELLESASKIWAHVAELATARLAAGAASQLEVTAVQSDARTANLEARRQEQSVRIAEARLVEVLNLPPAIDLNVSQLEIRYPANASEPPPLEKLAKHAAAARPEIRAAELALEAAGRQGGLAVAEIFNLVAALDANGRGTQGFEMGPAFQLTLPIFDQNQEGRARAQAELQRTSWQYLVAVRQVEREVAEAYHGWRRAQDALAVWPQEIVQPLETNVKRAESAYRAGGANYLEVLDATRRLIAAQTFELELQGEARRARIALERSVGGRIDAAQ